MIVIAAKVSVRKILACVLAAGTVLTGAAVLLPADAQPAAAASENMRLDVKLRTNEQRVALLRDCGWEVIEEPRGEREGQIPEVRQLQSNPAGAGTRPRALQGQTRDALHLRDHKPPERRARRYRKSARPARETYRGRCILAAGRRLRARSARASVRTAGYPLTGRRQNAQLPEICAIQRKRVRHISVCIEHFRGIALFLYFPIVQNAKKRYTIFSIRLAGETKCRRCDWTSCSVT